MPSYVREYCTILINCILSAITGVSHELVVSAHLWNVTPFLANGLHFCWIGVFLESSLERPAGWGNFPGLDVDKMDYLLRDAAALRINLKWEVRSFWVRWPPDSFQLDRFLEGGEPKLMDFPWGQEDKSIKEVYAMTASDKNQNNQNPKVRNYFTAYLYVVTLKSIIS